MSDVSHRVTESARLSRSGASKYEVCFQCEDCEYKTDWLNTNDLCGNALLAVMWVSYQITPPPSAT